MNNSSTDTLYGTLAFWSEAFLPKLLGAVIILVVGIWLSNLIAKLTAKAILTTKAGETVATFVQSFTKIALKIIVFIVALGTAGFDVTSIIATIGAAAVTIGLALQDSMKNVAGGIMILVNKPFAVGDFIEIESLQGTVKKIDISNTHMITFDNREVIIPNSRVASNNIINFSSQGERRVDMTFSISYDAEIGKVRKVVDWVIKDCEFALKNPEPSVVVSSHDESCIKILVRVWCKESDYWNVYYFMQEQVKLAFDKNEIQIPFPQIDVHNS